MADNNNDQAGPVAEQAIPAGGLEPVQRRFSELGICNNVQFLRHYISESPITADLHFAPLSRWPILPSFDHSLLLSLAYVYAETRYHANEVQNPALIKAMPIGETLAPMIPDPKFSIIDVARRLFVVWMKRSLTDNIFDAMGEYNAQTFFVTS